MLLSRKLNATLSGLALAVLLGGMPAPVHSQTGMEVEPSGAPELRAAMERIARDPNDPYALTDAGRAALQLGDAGAAATFFRRALAVAPNNGQAVAGLASANLWQENPFDALKLFDRAVELGIPARQIAADRGLAYDLIGNFAAAQREYVQASEPLSGNSLAIRRAASLYIAGKTEAGDAILIPLLRQNQSSAWRVRAFLLAAVGETDQAYQIARSFLPATRAESLRPFFAKMKTLTPAQQMAVVHFGHFPDVREVGRDSEAVRTASAATGGDRLTPSGQQLAAKNDGRGGQTSARESAAERRARLRDEREARDTARREAQDKANARLEERARQRAAEREKAMAEAERRRTEEIAEAESLRQQREADDAARREREERLAEALRRQREASRSAGASLESRGAVKLGQTERATAASDGSSPAAGSTSPEASSGGTEIVLLDTTQLPAPTGQATAVAPPEASSESFESTAPEPPAPENGIILPGEEAAAATGGATAPESPPRPGFALGESEWTVDAPQPTSTRTPALPTSVPGEYTPSVPDPAARGAHSGQPATIIVPDPDNRDGVALDRTAMAAPSADIQETSEAAPVAVTTDPDPVPAPGLGAIVAAIAIPAEEKKRDIVPVDLSRVLPKAPVSARKEPPKPVEKKVEEKPPAKEKYPARDWVQIATGQRISALAFDFRKMKKENAALFGKMEGWTSAWGRTNRLVIGPFDSIAEAKKFDAAFRKGGGDSFVWQSEDGTVVEPLP